MRRFLAIPLAVVIIASLFAATQLLAPPQNAGENSDFRFGVSFCGNTTAEAKLLIDRVKNFTNLLVVQSGPVSVNETAMNEIVDYAVAEGLDVIAYFGYFNPDYPWQVPWLDYAKQRWGTRFLGIYLNDEPAGKVIDANWTGYFNEIRMRNSSAYYSHTPAIDLVVNGSLPIDNTDAAYHFVDSLRTSSGIGRLKERSITAYVSDYALYWFDYLGGYDTIFAQFGWNHSIPLTIGQVRGAATMQNKKWGVIITWTYYEPPYLIDGAEMYEQLTMAYMSGAKYAIIFDYPQIEGNPYGILTEDHFTAMERFWKNKESLKVSSKAEAAFVMPYAYGWGLRSEKDLIWGIWAPDNMSMLIWNALNKTVAQYGVGFDVVYDDPQFSIGNYYSQLYWWNQTQ